MVTRQWILHNVLCFVLADPCVDIERHKTNSSSKIMAMLKAEDKGKTLGGTIEQPLFQLADQSSQRC